MIFCGKLLLVSIILLSFPGCAKKQVSEDKLPPKLSLHDSIIQSVKKQISLSKQCTLRYIQESYIEDDKTGEQVNISDTTEISSNTLLILQLLDAFPHIERKTDTIQRLSCNCENYAQIICDGKLIMENEWQMYPCQIRINDSYFLSDTCYCSLFIDMR